MPSGDPPETRASRLDAVTVDAFGTLIVLEDPSDRLRHALAERGVERPARAVAEAFRAEAAFYRPRSLLGRDPESLAALRRECAAIFLDHLEAELEPGSFVPAFLASLRFRLTDGASEALDRLRAAGLALACVANWDLGLHEHLDRLAIADRFAVIVSSAEAGAEKPDPKIFRDALARLGVEPGRALHVGDEAADRDGARHAGLAYEPPPLATLPGRIGL